MHLNRILCAKKHLHSYFNFSLDIACVPVYIRFSPVYIHSLHINILSIHINMQISIYII